MRFAISATVIPSVYSNSLGNSWNLRSVTGFGASLRLFFPFLFFLLLFQLLFLLISHLILTISIPLLFSWTIFFTIKIIAFLIWSRLFLPTVSTELEQQQQLVLYGSQQLAPCTGAFTSGASTRFRRC